MDSFLIRYTPKRGWQEKVVEMPSMEKLLGWINDNAGRCRKIHILVVPNDGEEKA